MGDEWDKHGSFVVWNPKSTGSQLKTTGSQLPGWKQYLALQDTINRPLVNGKWRLASYQDDHGGQVLPPALILVVLPALNT